MKRPTLVRTASVGLILLMVTACVAGSGESQHAASAGWISQALLGFWHGVIAPVTLIGELINRFFPHVLPWRVRLYETSNTGVAYDVGFYLGLAGGPPIVFNTWSRRG